MKPVAAVLAALSLWMATAAADDKVGAAERAMTGAYAALADKLDGAAKVHFEADQARWRAGLRACDVQPSRKAECLELRYRQRASLIEVFAEGPYPFVSQQAIVQSGNGPRGRYLVDIAYPRFDSPSQDFSAADRVFSGLAQTSLFDAIDTGRNCEITQTFSLYRLAPSVASVTFWREWVGPSIDIDLAGYLVDLSTGRLLEPQDVFTPGDGWRHRLAELVRQELAKDPPDGGRKGVGGDIASVMREVDWKDYMFENDRLVLSLNKVATERGMKGYEVVIPYAAMKDIFRADGPLRSLQR
ncbi:DUF1311 domain-containing protein [Reyranella soli]|uniref:DUF3298 domain-containing protein n=1 Tax=Reyranella soli TaxID=1230389 RepID=A0A512N462_9HYPH|nr:DUF1311 domain-containing protein [Reyranella soli]GEP53733.1 hypothetical protein RSO01_08990 [Reyranella soli]